MPDDDETTIDSMDLPNLIPIAPSRGAASQQDQQVRYGELLRRFRESFGLTPAQAARRLRLEEPEYRLIEGGLLVP